MFKRKSVLVLFPMALPCVVAAHGTMETPVSRVYSCFQEGPENPKTPACKAAVEVAGPAFLYDWAGVNQLPNGDHKVFVPDGHLCSANKSNYFGFNLARSDWPTTTIAADMSGNYDFNQPLKWSDLDSKPFCEVNSMTLVNSRYKIQCRLPVGQDGTAHPVRDLAAQRQRRGVLLVQRCRHQRRQDHLARAADDRGRSRCRHEDHPARVRCGRPRCRIDRLHCHAAADWVYAMAQAVDTQRSTYASD